MVGTVTTRMEGREGRVFYSEGPGRVLEGYFEFGGDDVVAVVSFGSPDDWAAAHPWAVERRDEILRLIATELIREDTSNVDPEINPATGVILLRRRAGAMTSAPPSARPNAAAFFWRLNRLKALAAAAALGAAVVVGGLALMGQEAVTMAQPAGSPLNESVRYEGGVATLIVRTDPQGPRWSGRGGGQTVTVSLLLTPFDGAEPRLAPLVRGVDPGAVSLARVLGSDGVTVWVEAGGLSGVRLRDGAVLTAADLARANPGLDPSWWEDGRGMAISEGRLHVIRRDRSAAIDIDPETLSAATTAPRPGPPRLSPPDQAAFMAAGFLTSDGGWLGLLTPEDRPGRWVAAVEDAEAGNTNRYLTRGAGAPSSDRRRLRLASLEPVSETPYLNAGFLRVNADAAPLRLEGPTGALLIHTRPPVLTGTLLVSRVDETGRVLWTTDTDLDRYTLRQVLPGDGVSAFVGARLPEPGRVSEPLIVLLANDTGRITTHSLWR